MLAESAPDLHLLRRGRDGEARRDGVVLSAFAMPFRDQRPGVVIARLRRVADGGWGVAVHHHLAGDGQHVAVVGLGEEGLGRLFVHRTVGSDGRRAVADQFVEEEPCDAPCMLGVDEFRFRRKSVFVQPVEQFRAVGRDDLHLRIVCMAVDEAGQDEISGHGR